MGLFWREWNPALLENPSNLICRRARFHLHSSSWVYAPFVRRISNRTHLLFVNTSFTIRNLVYLIMIWTKINRRIATMPDYRRYYQPNACIFITAVTDQRIPLFHQKDNINLFFETLNNVKEFYSFELYAYVIMPDHFHWILNLDDGNENFSKIIHCFKRNFTLNYKKANNIQYPLTIWQKRFWDHIIRDEIDLRNHLDYIHWNPVKHKFVAQPSQYEFSSFEKFIENGFYPKEWGFDFEPQYYRIYGF